MKKVSLFNTLTRKKEDFVPIKPGKISFYHCGPTVYWTQHIGNLRGMTCGDLIVRSLRYLGYKVKHVRNYTDVGHLVSDEDAGEDKMEKGAKREGKTPKEIAAKYIKIFEKDTADLNLLEPDKKPRATKYIKEMIKMTQILLAKGYAYSTDLAIYFDTSKAKNYGQLSGQDIKDKVTGAGRGEISDPEKKQPADFALWFFRVGAHGKAMQFWPSPFKSRLADKGQGFPGWHLECSAMSKSLLGETIDIHLGGIEHIPVHHTNEIAQSEAANGVKFVNYWLHNEHLLVADKKMAKSEGTSYSLAEIKEQGFGNPMILRYFFLQAHYRSKQNFTWEALRAAENGYNRLIAAVSALGEKSGKINSDYKMKFADALADDFNLPQALSVVQELLKSDLKAEDKLATVLNYDEVLGLEIKKNSAIRRNFFSRKIKILPKFSYIKYPKGVDSRVKALLKSRELARKNKNWTESDRLRLELDKIGWLVEDTGEGQKVGRKIN